MTPQPIRLLLVEDSPEDAELVLGQIGRAGLEVDWHLVDTESDYLAHLRPELDLILCDYRLPQFDAPRALELLQQSGLEVPLIIISGTIGEETAVAAMRLGASDYLLKDRLARLGPAITAAVEKSTRRRLHAQAESELRESQDRFQMLANTITEVFWIANAELSEVHYVSPAYETLWGRSPETLYTNSRAWFEPVVAEDQERVHAAVYLNSSEAFDLDFRIHHPDGALRWIHNRSFPVRDASGRVIRMVGVASDITERRQLEAEYRQAQKMEALGQLAAGVAHDFNNLLTVIAGNASLLQQTDANQQSLSECSSEILNATESAAKLTRQLLMFSRKGVRQRHPTNLDLVVARLAKMIQRIVGEDVRLECRTSQTPPIVLADQGMLEQVLVNLIVNARDAMPSGGTLTIETALLTDQAGSPWVRLSVADNGEGIPAELLPRLFEPFFTTKEIGKGTGLGLATVYAIVEQHQGRVEVESEVGRGTTVEIHLPSCQDPVSESAPLTTKGPARATGTETILVVEDDDSVRKLLLRFLRRFGYTVLEANSGPSALDLWRAHAPQIDLLLTDMMLPCGMTGFEIAQRLRQDKPNLPVLFSSGYTSDRFVPAQEWPAGYFFLEKPYEPAVLAAALRECLDAGVPQEH